MPGCVEDHALRRGAGVRRAISSEDVVSLSAQIATLRSQFMSYALQMLESSSTPTVDAKLLAAAIDAMSDCAQACTADADADLREEDVAEMVTCIRLCLDCADVCTATAGVTSRQTAYDAALLARLLEACVAVCAACADECARHADTHAHCRVCEEACRRCVQACRELLAAIA
jgi:erythromycin esterase-like protein